MDRLFSFHAEVEGSHVYMSQAAYVYSRKLYFFGYKTEFFSFQNNPKNLDLSYKTDLDLWDCLEGQNSYSSKITLD